MAENEIPVKITFEEFVELVKKMRNQQKAGAASRFNNRKNERYTIEFILIIKPGSEVTKDQA